MLNRRTVPNRPQIGGMVLLFAALGAASNHAAADTRSSSGSLIAAGTILLDQFDPALGTLQEVVFESSFTSSVRFANWIYCPGNGICTGFSGGKVTAGTDFVLGAIGGFPMVSSGFQFTGCPTPSLSSVYCVSDPVVAKGTNAATASDAPTLALFTGNGTLGVAYSDARVKMADSTEILEQYSSYDATARVTYHYLAAPSPPVPEPTTFALFGLGALALSLRRFARR